MGHDTNDSLVDRVHEYPPEDLVEFERNKERRGIASNVADIVSAIRKMPRTMRQPGPVQFCTWLGLFCM